MPAHTRAPARPSRARGTRAAKNRELTWAVYSSVRESILNGTLPAGGFLSQVQLAREFGVSRGPVREALRMLQREGLVEAEVNHRGRVSLFSMDDLEQLYGMRIVHEALAIRVSVPLFSSRDLDRLTGHLARMDDLAQADIREWQTVDREFHFALVSHAGERMMRTIRERTTMRTVRFHYIKGVPRALSIAASEHRTIVDGCARRDPDRAADALTRHLARTALTIISQHAPEHDPTTVRAAIRLATGRAAPQGRRPRTVRKTSAR